VFSAQEWMKNSRNVRGDAVVAAVRLPKWQHSLHDRYRWRWPSDSLYSDVEKGMAESSATARTVSHLMNYCLLVAPLDVRVVEAAGVNSIPKFLQQQDMT